MRADRLTPFCAIVVVLLAVYSLGYFASVRVGPSMWSVIDAHTLWVPPPDYSLIPSIVREPAEQAFTPIHFLDKNFLRREKWSKPGFLSTNGKNN